MATERKKKTVKTNSPYPLDGELVLGGVKLQLLVTRMNQKGMVALLKAGICHVGKHYQCHISLPTSNFPVQLEGQVFKTNDNVSTKTGKVERMVEVLFTKMGDAERARLGEFLSGGKKE